MPVWWALLPLAVCSCGIRSTHSAGGSWVCQAQGWGGGAGRIRTCVQLRAHTTCWPQPCSAALCPRCSHCCLPPAVTGMWVCQTRQIKSATDLPQLLVPQVTVKTEWVEYKVCLASVLLIVVSFLRERVLLVPGSCRWAPQSLAALQRSSHFLWHSETPGLPHVGMGHCRNVSPFWQ